MSKLSDDKNVKSSAIQNVWDKWNAAGWKCDFYNDLKNDIDQEIDPYYAFGDAYNIFMQSNPVMAEVWNNLSTNEKWAIINPLWHDIAVKAFIISHEKSFGPLYRETTKEA